MGVLFQPIHLLVLLAVAAVFVIPHWIIFKKAGFSPALSILVFIPFVGLIVLYVVAFSPWKVVPIAQVGWAQPGGLKPPFPPSIPPQA